MNDIFNKKILLFSIFKKNKENYLNQRIFLIILIKYLNFPFCFYNGFSLDKQNK